MRASGNRGNHRSHLQAVGNRRHERVRCIAAFVTMVRRMSTERSVAPQTNHPALRLSDMGWRRELANRIVNERSRHTMSQDVMRQDHRNRNAEQECTFSYYVRRPSMRILELENRTGNRTVGSHPLRSHSMKLKAFTAISNANPRFNPRPSRPLARRRPWAWRGAAKQPCPQ